MAVAVGRCVMNPSHNLADSSGRSTSGIHPVALQQWHTCSPKLLGGISMRCLRGSKTCGTLRMRKAGAGRIRALDDDKPSDPMNDPFDYGRDPDMEYGDFMTEGKQSAGLPRPPLDRDNDRGYLKFPPQYNAESTTLGLYIRGDVRRCLCWVDGGVYENLLFFPAIQLLKNRYPGVIIDVVAGERGKQVYEMNKYINRPIVFDTDAEWVVPADLVAFLGDLRGEYYDMILSTTFAGFKHASFLFMVGGRTERISYVSSYHSEWTSTRFLSQAIVAPCENLADGGYHMYKELLDYVARPGRDVPREEIPPLQASISKRVRSVVKGKENEAGLSDGKFVVFHGIESDSAASMTSRGDKDCLLPLQFWSQLERKLQSSSRVKVVIVIPHQKEKQKVFDTCGSNVSVVFITTPGQLGSLIRDSAGVVSTNTAAMQLAVAFKKPSVALFGSAEKASLFVPPHADKIKVVASTTGKLADVSIDEAASAWTFVSEEQLVLAA